MFLHGLDIFYFLEKSPQVCEISEFELHQSNVYILNLQASTP